MKRFLLPLLAALALPTAVSAESYWLVFRFGSSVGSATEAIEMKSLSHCEEQAKIIMKNEHGFLDNYDKHKRLFGYVCITGK